MLPYSMKYYYNGLDKINDFIDVTVYWFSLVDVFGSQALCYTIDDPKGNAPVGLVKNMWISVNNRFLVPIDVEEI